MTSQAPVENIIENECTDSSTLQPPEIELVSLRHYKDFGRLEIRVKTVDKSYSIPDPNNSSGRGIGQSPTLTTTYLVSDSEYKNHGSAPVRVSIMWNHLVGEINYFGAGILVIEGIDTGSPTLHIVQLTDKHEA